MRLVPEKIDTAPTSFRKYKMPVTRSSSSLRISEKEAANALLMLKNGLRSKKDQTATRQMNTNTRAASASRPKRHCANYTPGMYYEEEVV